MGAGALTICHNKTAVLVTEDMKKMVQIPILRPRPAKNTKVFGAPLSELQDRGLVEDGVPVVLRRLVEHLRRHALRQEGLFRVNGNVRAVETLKQQLEAGEDLDLSGSDSCAVASLIKQFLRDLPGGLVSTRVQQALIHRYHECGDDVTCSDVRDLLQPLPDMHYHLLSYLCRFLTLVESNHKENRMTAFNLATVFGPTVFHVSPGIDAMKDQNVCNKIMVKLIQNCTSIFESSPDAESSPERSTIIVVKEVNWTDTNRLPSQASVNTTPADSRTKMQTQAGENVPPQAADPLSTSCANTLQTGRRTGKVRNGETDARVQVPQPRRSAGCPRARTLSIPIVLPLTSERRCPGTEAAPISPTLPDTPDAGSALGHPNTESHGSPRGEERPISPFYVSPHLSPARSRPDVVKFLNGTISSVVEQHLFSVNPTRGQCSGDCQLTPRPPTPGVSTSARQRRRQRREQQEELLRRRERSSFLSRNRIAPEQAEPNKENIPSREARIWDCAGDEAGGDSGSISNSSSGHEEPAPQPRKHSPTLVPLSNNQDARVDEDCAGERTGTDPMETFQKGSYTPRKEGRSSQQQTFRMKIQEPPVSCDAGRVGGGDPDCDKPSCEDVPRLDLTALTEENHWGAEPVPAYSSLQRENTDLEEPRLSPHAGGFLIRQLLEEDSDPMVSPRFYAYGQCQQYVSDTEVPPSPPNAHSFISRRRSSSLGSCDDEKEELTTAQLTKRIHVLKKKIHRFEEKFEEEHKYRPSHGDKAANPEVLRWVNELSKLRKDLKEHKLMKSEEDLQPLTRQRSNTLPKSFGSQLEKKPAQEKVPKPPAETTLETILKKLQEKRGEVNRPEDIKDMTREQIGAEKVALQKGLLYYESIHGRPVTKNERQIMKPLYDRYRLVKQILCRASTIPVIEEEDGSEDDGDSKTQFAVSVHTDVSVLSFLDHIEEDVDGFISPVDELSTTKTTDMRLSNLHSATTQELVEQLQEAREEKKRLRENLKEFEDQFFRQNGRNVQKEDRSPLAAEYSEYKHVKAKLRLLEVLISKRDSTKFI
ncbi:protein FAM13A isoform X4 [Takifugu flavidus]|uniref:protein FAM13A isoform X4 n=1 Tax=Takifugu flavidus TaxID=433684 RepID=UPI002544AD41|nr:protein FAM13A isoform X4 [Takifugu flavidus]